MENFISDLLSNLFILNIIFYSNLTLADLNTKKIKMAEKTITKKYDFKDIENNVSKFWKENDIKNITIKHDPNKEIFSWLEGPPTANAPPGLHHVEVRVFKDLFCRYKFMQGYSVPRKGGWDCHGLPVEVQVEKKLGLKTKKEVLKYGEKKFIEECKTDVFTFIKDWERVTERLAFWVDLENPYRTLDTSYMESVWWSLSELHKKNLLYQGHKVVPYCPRCETPLSSHEVALGYKDVEEDSVTVKFKLKDDERYILAWTTTPWTLISNLALAVNPEITYATIEEKGQKYIMAKDLVFKYFPEAKITEEFKGKELEGKEYEPLYNFMEKEVNNQKKEGKKAFIIINADYVSTEDGTGVVHQAPAFGEDDYNECRKNNIAFINPVDRSGEYLNEVKPFKGRFVKDCDKDIIDDLLKRDVLIKVDPYLHAYPFCWRCSTPLLYYAMDSWFVSVNEHSGDLVKDNKKISWYPNHIKDGRFGNWIEGAKDWAISRNKFWGTPLPIWICDKCGEQHAIGSIKEIEEKTGKKVNDLHKPVVDPLTFKCEKCEGTMRRTPEVIDCWYDSGSAPFAQYHYPFENKEIFEKSHPYDFIAEAIDQTRGWFYTMHVIGSLIFEKNAYKSCAVGGLLCDENGEKMSKSKGNIVKPDQIFDETGVDAVRMLMSSYPLGEQIKFGMKPMQESVLPFFNTLWNSYYFAASYMEQFSLSGKDEPKGFNIEDKWIMSKTDEIIEQITKHLDNHEYNHCIAKIQGFVTDDLSRWYIKLIRERTLEEDKALAYTFRYVFDRLVRLLAPFTPYVSEKLYQEFIRDDRREISVHMESWPKPEKINKQLNNNMQLAREFVQGILAARDKAQIGVRWPVKEAIVDFEREIDEKDGEEQAKKALKELEQLVFQQTNIKGITFVERFEHLDHSIKPNYRAMGEDFGTETGDVLNHVKTIDDDKILKALIDGYDYLINVNDKEYSLNKKHFEITKTTREPWAGADFKYGTIYLNKEIPPELIDEGYSRELTRRIQDLRKKSGLEKTDDVEIHIQPNSDIDLKLEDFIDEMKTKVGAKEIIVSTMSPQKDYEFIASDKIKGNGFTIHMNKL